MAPSCPKFYAEPVSTFRTVRNVRFSCRRRRVPRWVKTRNSMCVCVFEMKCGNDGAMLLALSFSAGKRTAATIHSSSSFRTSSAAADIAATFKFVNRGARPASAQSAAVRRTVAAVTSSTVATSSTRRYGMKAPRDSDAAAPPPPVFPTHVREKSTPTKPVSFRTSSRGGAHVDIRKDGPKTSWSSINIERR
ncbi:hypothetical protein Vretifemale_13090, partial [Volvox reticuliferus]